MAKQAKKEAAEDGGDSKAIRDDEGDNDLEDEKAKEDLMNKFMDLAQNPGIDDNPECEFNPVWEYKIKRQKELDRIEFMRKRAEEEGFDLDEDGGGDGGGAGAGRQNALATLVQVGARVTSVLNKDNAAAQAAKDMRRKMKNIETFLVKQMDVDIQTTKAEKGKRMEVNRKLTAYEKAMDTKKHPAGADALSDVGVTAAKFGRGQLKEIARQRPELLKPVTNDSDEDRQTMARKQAMGADDLASLQLLNFEIELGDGEEGEEEGEGEDGKNEDESQLVA